MYKKLIATIALLFASTSIHAQTKTDDYGGLGNYPVPEVAGGSSEFQYCVVYAKRAWRVANMIDGGAISVSKAKAWARAELGRNAAAVEIEDFERFEKKNTPLLMQWPESDSIAALHVYA